MWVYFVQVFILKDENLELPIVHWLKMAASYILLKLKGIWSKDKLGITWLWQVLSPNLFVLLVLFCGYNDK